VSLAGTAIVTAASYQWLDRPIALLFPRAAAHHESFAPLTQIPNPLVILAAITFIGLGLWNLSGRVLSRPLECTLLASISLIIAEITKAQLKYVFGRTWPNTWTNNNPSFLRDGVYGFNFFHGGPEYASFPSGHMAVTGAVVSVLWVYFPRFRFVYVLGVLTVAVGLIGMNYHFLSDIIAGSFVGISSGWMMTALWKAHEHVNTRK
jgi:membrane-associated phospholipid phosphatase